MVYLVEGFSNSHLKWVPMVIAVNADLRKLLTFVGRRKSKTMSDHRIKALSLEEAKAKYPNLALYNPDTRSPF